MQGWSSDWEKLFSKCLTDKDYLTQLLAALDANDDTVAGTLLESIEAGGADAAARSARLNALKEARSPMRAVSSAFGADPSIAVAP